MFMNLKNELFGVSVLLMLLFSCTNEVEKPEVSEDMSEPGYTLLDLTNSISDFAQLKSSLMRTSQIKIITPSYERNLINVAKDDAIVSDESVYLKTSNDSISIMLSDDCITIISQIAPSGPEYYLLHESDKFIQDYAKELSLQTKSDDGIVTKQTSSNIILLTGLKSKDNMEDIISDDINFLEQPDIVAENPNQTKSVWPDRWLDVVRIWLIRNRGFGAMQHEVNWQQQHAITMMRSVNRQVKIEFYTRYSNFSANNDAYETHARFKAWLDYNRYTNYEWAGSVDKDIFVLISHGIYNNNIAGVAHVNAYKKSRRFNPMAVAISSVNPITSNMTLAHEIGHLLGAEHTDYKWWERWSVGGIWKRDVMGPGDSFIIRSAECREPNNVRRVRSSLE